MISIRSLVEKTKQRLHVGDKTFKPTPNVRNPSMYNEAHDFSRHLVAFKNMLQQYEKHMSMLLATLPVVASTNLPRVWEAVEGTNMCEPRHPDVEARHPFRTGSDYDEVLLADAGEIMRRRMEAITRPIDRWLESLAVVKSRMGRVEELRVKVDARRRRAHKRWLRALRDMTAGQAASIRAQTQTQMIQSRVPQGGRTGGVPAGTTEELGPTSPSAARSVAPSVLDTDEDEMEGDIDRRRHQEDYAREAINQHRQLEALSESYREQEQLVFEQLSGLVRDAAYFKSYLAASFLVVKDALQASLVALGPCKRPLPGFSERDVVDTGAYGRMASIMDMIESLPPVIKEGGRQLPRDVRSPLALMPEQIRPSRMTAQPLQVAADDVSAPASRYEPVPSVTKSFRATETDQRKSVFDTEAGNGQDVAAPPAGYGGSTGSAYEGGGTYGWGYAGGESNVRTFPPLQEEVAR